MTGLEWLALVPYAFVLVAGLIAHWPWRARMTAVPAAAPRVHVPRPGAEDEADPQPPFATAADLAKLEERVERLETIEAQRERLR